MVGKRSANIQDFFRIVYTLIPGFKKTFIIFFLLILVNELIKFIPPYFVKLIIDGVIVQEPITTLALYVLGIFIVLAVMTIIGSYLLAAIGGASATQQRSLLENSLHKLFTLPLSWHEQQNTGSLVSKITKASNYIGQLIWFLNNEILPSIIQLFLTGAILFWVDWRLGIVYLFFAPIILYVVNYQFKKAQPIREQYHQAHDDATNLFAQNLYNIKTIKDYAQETREEKEHKQHLLAYEQGVFQKMRREFWQISLRDTLTNIVRSSTTLLSIYLVYQGALTPGDLVFVFTIVEKAFLNLHRLGRVYTFMGDTYSSLERALIIQETPNALPDTGRDAMTKGDLILDDVSFSYGDGLVLKNISLTIEQNKTTALVGRSGSGKSTLVQLLLRHYDPTSGTILLGSTPLPNIPLNTIRKSIAFVSQQTELFDRTIYENITYANPKATKQEVEQAAKQAHAHEFIKDFPKRYDTMLGERGVRLSGGQQQRISIARALLSKADIIIFDEATSSLDSESEQAIQQAILEIQNKTVIIIAHRLSTIEHADKVVVLQDGLLKEQGTHEELLAKKNSLYKDMRDLQQLGMIRK